MPKYNDFDLDIQSTINTNFQFSSEFSVDFGPEDTNCNPGTFLSCIVNDGNTNC